MTPKNVAIVVAIVVVINVVSYFITRRVLAADSTSASRAPARFDDGGPTR